MTGSVLAHGDVPAAPTLAGVLTAWAFEPLVWVAVAGAAVLYRRGVRAVAGWPRGRSWCAAGGLAALLVALGGPPAVYEDLLFWVHMVQHLLIVLVAAPLLVYAAPVTLALRAAAPPARGRLLRVVHSRPARAAAHPVVAWASFGAVMWASHYSPLYDAALEAPALHAAEHVLYLGAALLFWAPVAGADPVRRIARPLRVAYLLAALPVQSFLGLAVYSADEPLYDHYEGLGRIWGPGVMDDQELAGIVMWIGGDVLLLAWVGVAAAAWLRAESREEERVDRRLGAGREKAPPP
ncbi:MAG TPA: cytochrome c oxidase assembly protein [Actinomycetota bacterium]|nr:cytochrome c oxidase assembly protein [Actinomycetota bacterium]